MPNKSKTLLEIAQGLNVSTKTAKKWISTILPKETFKARKRIYLPKEVAAIKKELGDF